MSWNEGGEPSGYMAVDNDDSFDDVQFSSLDDHLTFDDNITSQGTGKHRILLLSVGAWRGDVQPFVGLAQKLCSYEHSVAIVANSSFKEFVAKRAPKATFFPLEGDPLILQSNEFKTAFFAGDKVQQLKVLMDALGVYVYPNMLSLLQYVQEWKPTGIVASMTNLGEALSVAHKYLIPVLCASTVPVYPSKHTAPVGLLDKALDVKWLNSAISWAVLKAQWAMTKNNINKLRKEKLQLPSAPNLGLDSVPLLYMFSEKVIPRASDTPSHVVFTGYWTMDEAKPESGSGGNSLATPTGAGDDVTHLLSSLQSKPVYIGFGNMPIRNELELIQKFSSALEKEGLQGVYCSNVVNFTEQEFCAIPNNIKVIKEVSHEWLLPQCCVAFHHGGAGTTAASLRAGIPTVILPVLVDQPFWASRIVSMGVGQSEVCALTDVTTEFILAQLRHCLQENIMSNAHHFGEQLRKEDGLKTAASYIVSCCNSNPFKGFPEVNYLPDSSTDKCLICATPFTLFFRRHHCVTCGTICCDHCVKYRDIVNYETFRYCCKTCHQKAGWDFQA